MHIPGHLLPEPQDGIFQLYLTNKRTGIYECMLIGSHEGTNVRLHLDPLHRHEQVRIHDNSSYAVERFITGTAGNTNTLITGSGWYAYQGYDEIDGGYTLHLLNDWEEPETYDAFYEERVDRAFIGWYNTRVYARRTEMALRDFLGYSREDPMYLVLDAAYVTPGTQILLNQYWEGQAGLTSAPHVRG